VKKSAKKCWVVLLFAQALTVLKRGSRYKNKKLGVTVRIFGPEGKHRISGNGSKAKRKTKNAGTTGR